MRKACIKATTYYLPKTTLSNADLCKIFPDLEDDDIFRRTGVRNRHITSDGIVGSDLGYEAAEQLFKEYNIDKSSIDFLLFCTEGLDYKGPVTACVLQDRLGLEKHTGAMDIPMGCTGFTYGMALSKSLVESGLATNVLLITSDIPSTVIHPDDADLRMIFGDAGAATIISLSEDDAMIGEFVFGTDGSGKENLMVHNSGTRQPLDKSWFEEHEAVGGLPFGRMSMNGAEIFIFALKIVPPMMGELLEKSGLTKDDIDLYIFHQANGFMLKVLRRKLKLPEEKFFIWMEDVGNTVSATIPIALKEAMKAGKAKKGDKVLLAGFGIGYSWSATVVTL
jgi:3-oxoacyl-[acyl-carrier-protein] synthase-3